MQKTQSFCFILLGVAIPTSIFVTNIIIGILSLLWIVEGGFSHKVKQIKSSKWMVAVLSLVVYYGIAMLWGDNHNNSLLNS